MAQMDVPYNFLKNNTLVFLHINEINGLKKWLDNFRAWLVDVVCALLGILRTAVGGLCAVYFSCPVFRIEIQKTLFCKK
jgi:hypothetical protein